MSQTEDDRSDTALHGIPRQRLAVLDEEFQLRLQKQLGPTRLVRRFLDRRDLRDAQLSRNKHDDDVGFDLDLELSAIEAAVRFEELVARGPESRSGTGEVRLAFADPAPVDEVGR